MIKGKVLHFDKELEVVKADFKPGGNIVCCSFWQIGFGQYSIKAVWSNPFPAIVAYRPQEVIKNDYCFYSNLFFTDEAFIEVNGKRIRGKPYRDIWIEVNGGGERSSCVFALGESFIRP